MCFRGFKVDWGWRSAFVVLGFAWGLAGCSSDDDHVSASEGCRILIDTFCSKAAECKAPSARSATYQDCTFALELDMQCNELRALGPNYDQCLDEIPAADCATIAWPQSCNGVLVF